MFIRTQGRGFACRLDPERQPASFPKGGTRDINLPTGRDAHTSADEAETFLIVNLAA